MESWYGGAQQFDKVEKTVTLCKWVETPCDNGSKDCAISQYKVIVKGFAVLYYLSQGYN